MSSPLAEQLRPKQLSQFVGQEKVVSVIKKLLETSKQGQHFPSLLLWGPPGCGKTTLARLIARELGREFYEFSAVNTSVKDIEKIIPKTSDQLSLTSLGAPVIFLDEIHRFNKSQQDTLLPHVEKGTIILLGATTENPSFSVISALLSRCRVVILERLSDSELINVLATASLHMAVTLTPDANSFLVTAANGDARVALTVLELAGRLKTGPEISVENMEDALQRRQLGFDNKGEEFYNTISAFHKSIRGSDPNAALYWLARMLEAGQDPLYIARRLIRLASEDIGLAQPNALLIANAAYAACTTIGMPECKLVLAQACTYLARAPKSNALYTAYLQAAADVTEYGNLPVPLHIRNAPTKLMKEIGYGDGYKYEHSSTGQKNESISYLPDQLGGKEYLP
jgi:putative ATPase